MGEVDVARDSQDDLSRPLADAAREHPHALAVIDGSLRVTYIELARRVAALGGWLERSGISAGRRVGFLGVNSLAHLECWLGVPASGRVLVDLNLRLTEDELAFMVDDAGVEMLVVDRVRLEVGRALRERCAALRVLVLDGLDPPGDVLAYDDLVVGDPAVFPSVDGDALATISYTGGTTGTPKGVMLSHANLLANARHNLAATKHTARDRFLHVCPMFHVAGTSNVFASTWAATTQVVLPRFEALSVLRAIEQERITLTTLVPTMLAMLLDTPELEHADLSTLRELSYAASPISPDVQRRAGERLPGGLTQFYGMTEAAPTVSRCGPDDHRRGFAGEEPYRTRLASMGKPVPGVEVEIRDQAARALPPGEIGELWVRGPNVMLGYWNRPEATAAAIVDGWYRTGDAGRADVDGYLYMVDRLKDMIITGAENVYSIEVEATLLTHARVAEAAVFGTPDPRWGEAVHAVVVATAGATVTAEELVAHCRGRIAGFKVPRTIEIRDEPLPKSGAGKVLKNQLRDPFWTGRERMVG